MNLAEQIEKLKAERIEQIIDDTSISKIEKLKLFEKEKLFDVGTFLQTEFPDWEKEVVELERLEAERILKEGSLSNPNDICTKQFYQSKMTDTIFDPSDMDSYEKYQTVTYAARLAEVKEENEIVDDSELIAVITTRHPRVELKKSYQEVVDKVFEFCIKNKLYGFKNDW